MAQSVLAWIWEKARDFVNEVTASLGLLTFGGWVPPNGPRMTKGTEQSSTPEAVVSAFLNEPDQEAVFSRLTNAEGQILVALERLVAQARQEACF